MSSQVIPDWRVLQRLDLDWRTLRLQSAAVFYPIAFPDPFDPCLSVVRFFLIRAHPRLSAVSSVPFQSSSVLPSVSGSHPSPHSRSLLPSPFRRPTLHTWSCPHSWPLAGW